MLPIGPLMIEHRLIERMIALMKQDLQRLKDNVAVDLEFAFVDPVFIDAAVDFIRTYADRCHHGKEEDILFAELAKKNLSPEHRQIMEELIQEHVWGREATAKLVKAKENYLREHQGATKEILSLLEQLTEFYPRHIDKEDRHFFIPVMDYFTKEEKDFMLEQMWEFDRKMIHDKYAGIVEAIETRRGCAI
jgi:hemerythrin-like domain-containing protein